MQTTYKMQYTEVEIPKGCRKARSVSHEENILIEIREVKPEDAPVVIIGAFKLDKRSSSFSKPKSEDKTIDIDYRWFDGNLWRSYELSAYDDPKLFPLEYAPHYDSYSYRQNTRLQMMALINSWADGQIIIDGQVWKKAGEPVYEFGDYSGYIYDRKTYEYGTSLKYDHLTRDIYNSCAHKYFRADEFELAYSKLKPDTKRVKNDDGSWETVPQPFDPDIKAKFTVLAPSVLKMNTERYWAHDFKVEIISTDKHKIRTKDELLKFIATNPQAVVVNQEKVMMQPKSHLDERLSIVRTRESMSNKEWEEIEKITDSY